jgi:hypothetical protein
VNGASNQLGTRSFKVQSVDSVGTKERIIADNNWIGVRDKTTEQHNPSGPSIDSPMAEKQPDGVDGASGRPNVCWNNEARAPAEGGYYWRWDRFAMIIVRDQNGKGGGHTSGNLMDGSVTKYEARSKCIGGRRR